MLLVEYVGSERMRSEHPFYYFTFRNVLTGLNVVLRAVTFQNKQIVKTVTFPGRLPAALPCQVILKEKK